MASYIARRKFSATLLGGAAAWPAVARAQQSAGPVIGYLNSGSPESDASRLTGLRRGLNQTGYVEGRNLVIEYRWAGNQADRLPDLAADLVHLRVAVIVSAGMLTSDDASGPMQAAKWMGPRPGGPVMPNLQRCDVLLLNDDQTPMELAVFVLERFFGMTRPEAQSQMLLIHYEGRAICGTYPAEEAEKKVADVLAFAGEHKHPLQCVLEQKA